MLVACSLPRVADVLKRMLTSPRVTRLAMVTSSSAAREMLSHSSFDVVIVVCPLPDDFGTTCAREIRSRFQSEIMLIVPSENFEDCNEAMLELGVLVVSRPLSEAALGLTFRMLATMRERIRGLQERTATLEEKMAEIRVVNHAKWLLIDRLKMTEGDAQHYIEKQAMNMRVSKRKLAEGIIAQYE